jgi:hypothetical protein
MQTKIGGSKSRIQLKDELSTTVRSGGEARPFEYPHLYQIHAGDWRISYAVEHNRLAILVLEVLSPEGEVIQDPAHDKLTKKMKIKLLDLPEIAKDMTPDEVGKRLKIKLLDMTADMTDEAPDSEPPESKPKIKFVDSDQDIAATGKESATSGKKAKVTPLDSPSL